MLIDYLQAKAGSSLCEPEKRAQSKHVIAKRQLKKYLSEPEPHRLDWVSRTPHSDAIFTSFSPHPFFQRLRDFCWVGVSLKA